MADVAGSYECTGRIEKSSSPTVDLDVSMLLYYYDVVCPSSFINIGIWNFPLSLMNWQQCVFVL